MQSNYEALVPPLVSLIYFQYFNHTPAASKRPFKQVNLGLELSELGLHLCQRTCIAKEESEHERCNSHRFAGTAIVLRVRFHEEADRFSARSSRQRGES